jgi:hypothetical protein
MFNFLARNLPERTEENVRKAIYLCFSGQDFRQKLFKYKTNAVNSFRIIISNKCTLIHLSHIYKILLHVSALMGHLQGVVHHKTPI